MKNGIYVAIVIGLALYGFMSINEGRKRQREIIARLRLQEAKRQEEELQDLAFVPDSWYVYIFWDSASDFAKAQAIESALEQYTGQADRILKIPVAQLLQGQVQNSQGRYLPTSEIERLFPGVRQAGLYPVTYLSKLSVDGRQMNVASIQGPIEGEGFISLFEQIDQLVAEGY
ncbi:hypothetical protein [Phaeodactylibacter xiamenensis]|uniref:hypothetical protein n=1 Tax=Phaeodactylibacter xiamenensis TaxID=1524460 RepID=UPI0024A990AD|nr:hypothetical protein [Phaeodactylibacter xiamenensis]